MKYRKLGRTGMTVSEISLGCEHLQGKSYETVKSVIDRARMAGVNFLDVFMSEPQVRTDIGRALAGKRQSVMIQGHIGACWVNGQYQVSRDLEKCKFFFEDLLTRLQTDYIDVGMIHFLDKPEEWDAFVHSETMEYVRQLRASMKIRAVGLSCHDPITAKKAVDSGLINVLMFSINPAYDLMPKEHSLIDMFEGKALDFSACTPEPARAELYRACEEKCVAITVMKSLAAGTLLSRERSPLGVEMTVGQCLRYALTRPAVDAVMLGMQTPEEVDQAVQYFDLPEEATDYAAALAGVRMFADGRCMYCNHCLPCPAGIDIAAVNKYLDLVQLDGKAPESVAGHYLSMKATGGDCIACGACEKRCPFGVQTVKRMARAREVFGA